MGGQEGKLKKTAHLPTQYVITEYCQQVLKKEKGVKFDNLKSSS